MAMLSLTLSLVFGLSTLGYSYIPPSTVKALYSNLTIDKDPRLRPTYDQSQTVKVWAIAYLFSVLELSTVEQKLTVIMICSAVWTDQFLVWNATEYGGIDRLHFRIGEIWHPELKLGLAYTNEHGNVGDVLDKVGVSNNGTVTWSPTSSVSVLCEMDITFYPFDTQKCIMALFIPYALMHEMTLLPTMDPFDQGATIQDNPEWRLLDTNTTLMNSAAANFLQYTYLFRRRAEFIVYTTIVPLILLPVLNACVVLVPVSSGEKGSIAVTLFLSYCVYLTSIGETLPPNSAKTSYLLLYMTIVQTFSALTMLYSVVETRMYIYGHKTIYSLFSCFSKPSEMKQMESTGVHGGDADSLKKARMTGDILDHHTENNNLNVYQRLDSVVFVICVVLNAVIVSIFAILTINSMQDTLE